MLFKVLLADNDSNFAQLLYEIFSAKGYICTIVRNGNEAIDCLRREAISLCVLDLELPEKDGLEVAEFIKKEGLDVPFIFCSQRGDKKYRLQGLRLGAEDYLVKPIELEELLIKVDRVKFRKENTIPKKVQSEFSFGNFKLNHDSKQLKFYNHISHEIEVQNLTTKENELLKLFVENMNFLITREDILRTVWSGDDYFNARSLDVYITRLRKYLRKDESVTIINHHGVGFCLVTKNIS